MQQVSITVDSAWQMLAVGRFAEALVLAQQILRRSPDNVSALCCVAMAGWELGHDVHQCIATIQSALTLAPGNAAILHNLATLQASAGDSSGACATFEAALTAKPDDTKAFYGLTQNRRFTEETELVPRMLSLYGSGTLEREELEFLCFGLAKVYADIGNRGRAMHFCIEANWLAQRPFDRDAERRRFEAIVGLGEGADFPGAGGNPAGPAPLFIVGMPRSGTTLVEAILSRHPQVHALGETGWMTEIEHELTGDDPEQLAKVIQLQLRTVAERVAHRMRAAAGDGTRIITDKTPGNAFRLHVIAALFPHARVVHVTRHPLDCALSNLFVRFNAGQGFAFRQSDLGERIRQTSAVMDIWKRKLALPILELGYERLVADPETESRRLVAFAGLDWDARCLTPELAQRQVQTASQFQVRQKIHQGSVGRFRGYEEWLAPLIESLGGHEWIEAEFARQSAAR